MTANNQTAPVPETKKRFFKSFEAKSLRKRSFLTRIADKLTAFCGSTPFLIFHIIFFSVWVSINSGYIPGLEVYDPFPYGLLTMVVSLEAIFLSIFVLVSQNRSAHISTVRDEVHMKVNLIAEEEITKILQVLAEMRTHMGIKKKDEELEEMLKRLDTKNIERSILEQLQRAEKAASSPIPKVLTYPVKKPIEIIQGANGNGKSNSKNEKSTHGVTGA